MLKNNKGFSLIELMVVVAIIAILATIAIPSYQGFQSKARQKEGFALLNSYYTSSQATFAEAGAFPGDFIATGFQPTGQLSYRVLAVSATNATFPMFGSAGMCIDTSTMNCSCSVMGTCTDADFRIWNENPAGMAGMLGPVNPIGMLLTVGNMFTAGTASWISTTATNFDSYTINERKQLVMVQDGLN